MSIGKIGVVGAGTMGNGITQAFAVAGREVVMMDVGEAQVQLERLVHGAAEVQSAGQRQVQRSSTSWVAVNESHRTSCWSIMNQRTLAPASRVCRDDRRPVGARRA